MLITNYYRGGTDRVSGFVFDTEKKIYKEFVFKGKEWRDRNTYDFIDGFKMYGDLQYFFPTLRDMEHQLVQIRVLNFKEDPSMVLDFGIFTK